MNKQENNINMNNNNENLIITKLDHSNSTLNKSINNNSVNTINISFTQRATDSANNISNNSINKDHNLTKKLLDKYHNVVDNYNKRIYKEEVRDLVYAENKKQVKGHYNIKPNINANNASKIVNEKLSKDKQIEHYRNVEKFLNKKLESESMFNNKNTSKSPNKKGVLTLLSAKK